jgi:MFS family permease
MLKKLLVLIVTAFVDMVGLLMVIPLMPYYARDLGAGSLMVTVMVVSFTAAQLLSAPLWGRFSDKYGRRPWCGGNRLCRVRLCELDLAPVVVESRAGRRRRDSGSDSGVCRRFD